MLVLCAVSCAVFYVQTGVSRGPLACRVGGSLRPGLSLRACASIIPAGAPRPACVLSRTTDWLGSRRGLARLGYSQLRVALLLRVF